MHLGEGGMLSPLKPGRQQCRLQTHLLPAAQAWRPPQQVASFGPQGRSPQGLITRLQSCQAGGEHGCDQTLAMQTRSNFTDCKCSAKQICLKKADTTMEQTYRFTKLAPTLESNPDSPSNHPSGREPRHAAPPRPWRPSPGQAKAKADV